MLELQESCVGTFSVSAVFKNVVNGLEWIFSGVYGPNIDSSRSLLWDELAGVSALWDLPWCIGEDFNVTRFPSELLGGGGVGSAME